MYTCVYNIITNLFNNFIKVHESTASLPEGIVTGGQTAFQSYGLFDECIDTRGPNTTEFHGKYCSVFFYFEPVQPEELVNNTILADDIQHRGNWISYKNLIIFLILKCKTIFLKSCMQDRPISSVA